MCLLDSLLFANTQTTCNENEDVYTRNESLHYKIFTDPEGFCISSLHVGI